MPSNKTLFMDGPIADKQNEGVNERGMIGVVGFSVPLNNSLICFFKTYQILIEKK